MSVPKKPLGVSVPIKGASRQVGNDFFIAGAAAPLKKIDYFYA